MEDFKKVGEKYLELLAERGKSSKVYKQYQSVGLTLAKILDDPTHKGLYIKLAKENNGPILIDMAKKIAEKVNILKKGAYFMKVLKAKKNENSDN